MHVETLGREMLYPLGEQSADDLVWQRLSRPPNREPTFLASHAHSLAHGQAHAPVEGWWGFISFFANWFCLAGNLIAYRKATRLAEPQAIESDAQIAA